MKMLVYFFLGIISQQLAAADPLSLNWHADLRLRTFAERNGDQHSRLRERIRFRMGVSADNQTNLKAQIRLATSTDPREQDQTLGDSSEPGARRRVIGLDLGFIQWNPIPIAKVYAGRFPQIHFRPGESQLVLDEDIALEGVGGDLVVFENERWSLNVVGGSSYVRENYDSFLSIDQTDNMINFGQWKGNWKYETQQILFGMGFFNFVGMKGRNFSDFSATGTSGGNSELPTGTIRFPFLARQYFLQYEKQLDLGTVQLFGEWLQNGETSQSNNAFFTGFSVLQNKWKFSFAYVFLDKDPIPSAFANNEFANGETDSRGEISRVTYAHAPNLDFQLQHTDSHLNKSDTQKSQWTLSFDANFRF